MVNIIATIRLYDGQGMRKTGFHSGYRPLFNFIPEMKTSGQITLIDMEEFLPGNVGLVKICLSSNLYLGTMFNIGTKFTFGEGGIALGEGEILQVLNK